MPSSSSQPAPGTDFPPSRGLPRSATFSPGRAPALALLGLCGLIAERVGLVALIAGGYRLLAWVMLAVYVLPLATVGVWRLAHRSAPTLEAA